MQIQRFFPSLFVGLFHCKITSRILGGEEAAIVDFPWQLSLQEEGDHTCGASILSVNRALTAAHCYDDEIPLDEYSVTAGSHRKNRSSKNHIGITRFILHPDFIHKTNRADIAILFLEHDLIFSEYIQPIRLPAQNAIVTHGTRAVVAGWGRVGTHKKAKRAKRLRFVELKVYDNENCNIYYEGDVLPDMFCAGWENQTRDSLRGDSGGALVVDNTQIGVVSWGKDCTEDNFYPGVYIRVSHYTNWIKSVSWTKNRWYKLHSRKIKCWFTQNWHEGWMQHVWLSVKSVLNATDQCWMLSFVIVNHQHEIITQSFQIISSYKLLFIFPCLQYATVFHFFA